MHKSDLFALYSDLHKTHLASANVSLISDIIACPGMDYCVLATARSIPIAQKIAVQFDHLKQSHNIGDIEN